MSQLTEADILRRFEQSLGEAHRACQGLGRHADSEYVGLRGKDYTALKTALELMEGCARQIAQYRRDARWLKLAKVYALTMRSAHLWFIGQRWNKFNELTEMFVNGRRVLDDLANRRTGRSSDMAILPEPGNMDWVRFPDLPMPGQRRRLLN